MDFMVADLDNAHLGYVREQLEQHADLTRRLGTQLKRLDLERGRLWAIVPVERAEQALGDLESDPIQNKEERKALARETARVLRSRLAPAPRRVLTIEWWNAMDGLYDLSAHGFLVGDSLFEYATNADPDETIADLLSHMLFFPTVGMIAPVPEEVDLNVRDLAPEVIDEAIANVELVLIGAWDADGYVFWEPQRD